ncbi:hypothetical protein JR316_0008554 [Psilocybe cubensis]|uniref:Uncharacterized protein n=2 Tax=Psilocybe cubensis TaxID=181762 RepID=A0A8H8CDU6_PSICU|nr:hypothetical protein JR316_0008554 [Psilocybe cubensis]KAH9479957.1 hypothetical protein JR316_0008554 [Psilocybe cubensis]
MDATQGLDFTCDLDFWFAEITSDDGILPTGSGQDTIPFTFSPLPAASATAPFSSETPGASTSTLQMTEMYPENIPPRLESTALSSAIYPLNNAEETNALFSSPSELFSSVDLGIETRYSPPSFYEPEAQPFSSDHGSSILDIPSQSDNTFPYPLIPNFFDDDVLQNNDHEHLPMPLEPSSRTGHFTHPVENGDCRTSQNLHLDNHLTNYLSTSSPKSSNAAKKIPAEQCRYIDIAHGGIWFGNAGPSPMWPAVTQNNWPEAQAHPTLSSVEELMSYFGTRMHHNLSGEVSVTSDFRSRNGEKEIRYTKKSNHAESIREESSGVTPVEPNTRLRRHGGGKLNLPSRTTECDISVASTSAYTRKRREHTPENNGLGTPTSVVKRPRMRSPLAGSSVTMASVACTEGERGGKKRVPGTLTVAPRPQITPAAPSCLATAFQQSHLLMHKRERHHKNGRDTGFQVITACETRGTPSRRFKANTK